MKNITFDHQPVCNNNLPAILRHFFQCLGLFWEPKDVIGIISAATFHRVIKPRRTSQTILLSTWQFLHQISGWPSVNYGLNPIFITGLAKIAYRRTADNKVIYIHQPSNTMRKNSLLLIKEAKNIYLSRHPRKFSVTKVEELAIK